MLVTIGGLFGSLGALPASAVGGPLDIQSSYCTSQTSRIQWWGSTDYTPTYDKPQGDVFLCWFKYKIVETGKNGDYWMMVAKSVWRTTSGPSYKHAISTQRINSSIAPIDGVYESTPTKTSTTECSQSFDVGFNIGVFGVSTTSSWCRDYQVVRDARTSIAGASWTSQYTGKLRTVETAYSLKVPEGSAPPRFTGSFGISRYDYRLENGFWVPYYNPYYYNFSA